MHLVPVQTTFPDENSNAVLLGFVILNVTAENLAGLYSAIFNFLATDGSQSEQPRFMVITMFWIIGRVSLLLILSSLLVNSIYRYTHNIPNDGYILYITKTCTSTKMGTYISSLTQWWYKFDDQYLEVLNDAERSESPSPIPKWRYNYQLNSISEVCSGSESADEVEM